MSQISIIKKSDIQEARRFDAEFFKPELLKIRMQLEKNSSQNLINFLDGNPQYGTTPLGGIFEKTGVNFIRSQDFQNNFINNIKQFCSEKFSIKNKKSNVVFGDILLAVVGATIGDCAIYLKNEKANINQNVARLRIKQEKLNKYFLIIFLKSVYAQSQILGLNTGNAQSYLNTEKVNEIKIPILPQSFQLQIEKIVKSAYEKQARSKQLYKEAEEALLKEVGLLDYKPEQILSYETTKKETDEAERFDAEYFQPKYEKIIKKIESYKNGWDFVKNIVHHKKGVEVGSETYQQDGMSFGRVSDFSINGVERTGKKISKGLYQELKKDYQPKRNDILFTKDGTIGLSYVVKEEFEVILSGAFLRLSLKDRHW